MAQLIIDGCCQFDVAKEIEKRIKIPKDEFQVKKVQSEKPRGDSFDVVTGHRSIIEQIYEARANLPHSWSIQDTPGPIDPLVVVLTYSSCYNPIGAPKIPADNIHDILLDAFQANANHKVVYGILLKLQLEDTPNWYRKFCTPEPAAQPVIKVDVKGLVPSITKPSIYDLETICEAVNDNGWDDHCILLTSSCTCLPRPKLIPIPREKPYLQLPEHPDHPEFLDPQ